MPRNKQLNKIILGLCLTSLFTPSVWAADSHAWPMFQNNTKHTGQVDRPVITKPKILWKAPVGITGWLNSPVIGQNKVFVPSSGTFWNFSDQGKTQGKIKVPGDGVLAFDLDTGKQSWFSSAQNDVNNIVLSGDKVIATGDEGAVWALNAETGEELWRTKIQGEGFQLLALDKQIVVGTGKGQIIWLNANNGSIKQRSQLDAAVRAGIAWDGEHFFTATTEGSIYCFDAQGELLWQKSIRTFYPELIDPNYPVRLEVYGAPSIYKDFVIIGFARDSYYETPALLALDRHNGKLRWKASAYASKSDWGNIRTSPAIYDHFLLYAEPYSNTIVALDADTGKGLGGQNFGAVMFPQWSSPALAGSTLYVPRFDGGLYALDAKNGDRLWQFYLGDPSLAGPKLPAALKQQDGGEWKPKIGDAIYTSPALANDGRILIPVGGFLYCIGQDK